MTNDRCGRRKNKMIAGMIAVGLRVEEKNNRLIGNFFYCGQHFAGIQRALELSIITTPSSVNDEAASMPCPRRERKT